MEKGQIVRSLKGSDKNTFLVVVSANEKELLLCDGKRYKLEKPKRKNPKHIAETKTILNVSQFTTDKAVRKALAAWRATL